MPYNSINLLKRMRKQEIGKQLKNVKKIEELTSTLMIEHIIIMKLL
jgi:hypothetical protein